MISYPLCTVAPNYPNQVWYPICSAQWPLTTQIKLDFLDFRPGHQVWFPIRSSQWLQTTQIKIYYPLCTLAPNYPNPAWISIRSAHWPRTTQLKLDSLSALTMVPNNPVFNSSSVNPCAPYLHPYHQKVKPSKPTPVVPANQIKVPAIYRSIIIHNLKSSRSNGIQCPTYRAYISKNFQ